MISSYETFTFRILRLCVTIQNVTVTMVIPLLHGFIPKDLFDPCFPIVSKC